MSESKTVRLGDLEYDPVEIPGQGARLKKLDDLLGNIPAKGLLQSLNVRPRGDGVPGYWVKAGKRRLATLRKLRDDKGEVQGVVVTDDFPVGVLVQDEDDKGSYETSVAENLQRLATTVVEEVRQIAEMAQTAPPKQIAAHFGITEKRVKQRLVLAQLHPDVLEALDAGKITIAAAEAFTLQPDPEKQAAHLKKTVSYYLNADAIRSAFTQKLVRGDSPVAKIIGKAAYKAAGGQVLGDLFDDKSYWTSSKTIDALLEAHWLTQIAAWKEEGWGFVETADVFCGNQRWKIYNSERLKKGQESAEDKAGAGVVYFPNGSDEPIIGIKRYAEPKDRGGYKPVADLQHPPGELRTTLAGQLKATLAATVVSNPVLALRLLVASLLENSGGYYSGPLQLSRDFSIDVPEGADGDEPERTFTECVQITEGWDMSQLVDELARILAQGLAVPHDRQAAGGIFDLLEPTIVFDADGYFAELTKPYLDLVWDDINDPSANEKKLKGKTSDVLAKVKQRAVDTGWLPPQLRTPSYTGPHFLSAHDEPDEDEGDEEGEEHLEAAE
jgi:ParB family transcriptional regulator, chromosome partitioning protein